VDGLFGIVPELQDALDTWVEQYNTARAHQSCGGRPPAERFALAEGDVVAGDSATAPVPAAGPAAGRRPGYRGG